MDAEATAVFLRFFTGLRDPRRHNVRHRFTDIITITILGVLCRGDDWTEVVEWARAEVDWLKTFLALPKGVPSADTFRRVFARIDPAAFESCFISWTSVLAEASAGRFIAIDGKTQRRSFQHAWERQGIHMVSAWCEQNQLVLGQIATDQKSNEITAIPKLLDLLNLKGAIITIDAMGCQTAIAEKIVQKEADFILAVKDNQPTLCDKVECVMNDVILDMIKGRPVSCGHYQQTNGGHGRIETRNVWVSDEVWGLGPELLAQWPALKSMAVVECRRQDLSDPTGKISVERRLFISSLSGCDAKRMADAVRGHWGVENQLHWRLDMGFREDESRLRMGHGAENFSRVRRIVLNKLKADPRRVSLKVKRYRCAIDREYLLNVLKA